MDFCFSPVRGEGRRFSQTAKIMETETSNQLIVRYLLGNLPEAEQVQVEVRAFTDRGFLRYIEEAENDLIDDYVRGTLTEVERRQFESHFFASVERQKKVEFARALAHVTAATATEKTTAPVTQIRWWESLASFLGGWHPVWQFSMAATTLLLVLGLAWLFTVTRGLRTQIAELQAAQQTQQQQEETIRQQAALERARSEELTAQLERERARHQELAQQREREKPLASATAPKTILSLFLPPIAGRGDDNHSKLILPPGTKTVRVQLGLERGDDFKSYGVTIAKQGQTIWARTQLHPRGRTLLLTLPSQLLRAGQYEITLKGVTETQQTEDVRFYYFDVLTKQIRKE